MNSRDRSERLTQIVEKAIEEHGLDLFEEYWELYQSTADISDIQWFFVTVEQGFMVGHGGYCNVAIIGDGLLVDIEGDDGQRSGGLTIQSLDSVTGVSIHAGSLPGLRNSQNATLIVIADQSGDPNIGLHWVAKNDDDDERLVQFAKVLVDAVSNR